MDNAPATKQDLLELETRLLSVVREIVPQMRDLVMRELIALIDDTKRELIALIDEKIDHTARELIALIDEKLDQTKEELKEFSRSIETNLLTSFHGYAKGQTARMHSVETGQSDLAIRVGALEERVLNLEARRPS